MDKGDRRMDLRITCIPGDGIGPEIVAEAKKVLNKVAEKYVTAFTELAMPFRNLDASKQDILIVNLSLLFSI